MSKGNKYKFRLGLYPGSKKEAFTVKSKSYTYLNVQADAVTWVKDAIETRRNARKARRYRKCPCRQPRFNKAKGSLTPSTKARWQWKLRILAWLKKLYPISNVIVEDIKAVAKGRRKWDKSFSPLEVGKNWFYSQISNLTTMQGYETCKLRNELGLKKTKNKLSKSFDAHCVDSWVLSNSIVGGHIMPDNKKILYIRPLRFHRRQLHVFQPSKDGIRKNYGGTMSMGFKRGSLVKHKKHGLMYVGGTSKNRISLYNMNCKRIGQSFLVEDCKFMTYNNWLVSS